MSGLTIPAELHEGPHSRQPLTGSLTHASLRLPGLVFGVAELLEAAAVAFWFAGDADLSAVADELVTEGDPAGLRDDAHQVLFYFGSCVSLGEREAASDAEDVGVDYDAFGFVEAHAQDHIGGFASSAGDGDEFGERLRDFAVEVAEDLLRRALDGFGLVVEEAGGADEVF